MLDVDATARIKVLGVRKSNFYQKHVRACFNCSPEVMATSWKCHTSNIDPALVDQLLKCYTESQISQTIQVSANDSEALETFRITRDLIERALDSRDNHDGEQPLEIIRDLRLNYNILRHNKWEVAQSKLLKIRPKKKPCGIFTFFSVASILLLAFAATVAIASYP